MSCDHGATLERYCDGCFDTLRAQLSAVEEKNRELEEQHAHDCDQFNRLAQEKADAEKERDEYRGLFEGKCVCGSHAGDDNKCPAHGPQRLRMARDAANERVKALETALEPTAENVRALWSATWDTERCFCSPDPCEHCAALVELILAAIRARAGLTKEGT